MLSVTALSGFGGGTRGPYTATYRDSTGISSGASSATFNNAAVGSASEDRYIVVVVLARPGTSRTVDSCTVAGNATTRLTHIAGTEAGAIFITSAPLTSGTTADVEVTLSGTGNFWWIATYSITGDRIAPGLTSSAAVQENDPSEALPVSAGGVSIAGALAATGSTRSWSGLTEDVAITGGNTITFASLNSASGNGVLTAACTFGTSSSDTMVAVSLGP